VIHEVTRCYFWVIKRASRLLRLVIDYIKCWPQWLYTPIPQLPGRSLPLRSSPQKSNTTLTPSPTSMSATTISSSNFQLVKKALADYADQTGIDLTENPFAEKLQTCDSAEGISALLQDRAKAFKQYRDGNRKLINCLNPVVQFLHTFSGTLAEALVLVSPTGSIRLF
jgi:hypothetical protein